MRILLIKPSWFRGGLFQDCITVRTGPLGLAMIATLSEGHDTQIIDGDIESISFSSHWDLVAITVPTSSAVEAYNIADQFRTLGVKVILGGVHPSMLPEESSAHADSVVIGEAESVWGDILKDFPNLKSIYQANYLVDINNLPFARRDLFHPGYRAAAVQATRGCVNKCKYCYLQNVPWKTYRKRSPKKFAEEIAQIKEPYLFFADDNLFVEKEYTLEIAQRITPYKKFWSCQAPITIGDDEDFVRELAHSGLSGTMLGLDSISKKTLDSASKTYFSHNLKHTVKHLRSNGIGVGASLVFGFDHDDASVFEKTLDSLEEAGFDSAGFFILTPYPGTELFEEMEKNKRIITKDWSRYNLMNPVFKPKQMTPEQLSQGVRWAYKEFTKRKFKNLLRDIPFYWRMIRRSPRLAWDLKIYLYVNPF
ncbi:MAG: B12-binding domain-containing radical SAM protein [Candidatus Omnitrophica bacterium]|nr:B12-binding domain-containing radical SAM protein [Candidatus Omnitrophota bacterium]